MVPITGLPVEKKITAMDLIFIEVKTPDVTKARNQNADGRITGGTRCDREEVSHFTWVPTSAWFGELDLEKHVVSLRGRAVLEPDTEVQLQNVDVYHVRRRKFGRIDREWLVGLWNWCVLISERIEAMISADEEILPADMSGVVKWRLMADYGLCQLVPLVLHLMRNGTPGCQRSTVDIELSQLSGSTWEDAARFVFVIALTAGVIEGQISH